MPISIHSYGFRRNSAGIRRNPGIPVHSCGFPRNFRIPPDSAGICGGIKSIGTCVGLQALAKMNTKFSKGLRYTGVGGIMCGRSEMIMPTGVGNLQKGEKYGFEKIL